MDRVSLTIDGREVEANKGEPLLEVARRAGIFIPSLCYLEGLPPHAGCRTCLVDIQGARGFQLACTTPVNAGMMVRTQTPELTEARRGALALLQANHPDRCLTCHKTVKCGPGETCLRDDIVTYRCLTCAKNKRCELLLTSEATGMTWQERYYFEQRSWYSEVEKPPIDQANPYLEFDPKLCILCARCVRACEDYCYTGAIGLAFRGPEARIVFGAGGPVHESNCDFCGACIDVCPTGTLMEHPHKWAWLPQRWVSTLCSYCSVGCALRIGVKDQQIIIVKPQTASPVTNQICVRGRFGYDAVPKEVRLSTPLIRREEGFTAIGWEQALELAASKLAEAQASYGGESIAYLVGGDATNEEAYLLQKQARTVLGTNNIDSSAMFLYRPVLEVFNNALSFGILRQSFVDIKSSSHILVVGEDIGATHPIAVLKVKEAVRRNGAKLLLIHPRDISLARFAEVWLRCQPGTEVALSNGLASAVLTAGAGLNLGDVTAAEQLRERLKDYDLPKVAEISGIPMAQLEAAGALLANGSLAGGDKARISILFGIPSEISPADAERLAKAILSLALLSKATGREVAIYPLAPEGNLQGIWDMGGTPDLLPGHQPVSEAETRQWFAQAWDAQLPSITGLSVSEMLSRARQGRIRVLVVFRDNPLMILPNTAWVREGLKSIDFVLAIGSLADDTTKLAHLVLPGPGAFERNGTFTNDDGHVQTLRAAVPPLGEAKPDWWILCELARRVQRKMGTKSLASFDYGSPSDVMREIAKVIPFYDGISYEELERVGYKWLLPRFLDEQKRRLLRQGATEFLSWADYLPEPSVGSQYPLVLLTGRPLFSSLEAAAGHSSETDRLHREEFVEVNVADATAIGLEDEDWVEVENPRGSFPIRVRKTRSVPPGAIFISSYYDGGVVNCLLGSEEGLIGRGHARVRLRKIR